jgi:hypothetical protein
MKKTASAAQAPILWKSVKHLLEQCTCIGSHENFELPSLRETTLG